MELHRDTARMVRLGLGVTAFGVLGIALPSLIALFDYEFVLGPWFWYIAGGIALLAGLVTLNSVRRPFRLSLHDSGLTVRAAGLDTTVAWDSVHALTIERLTYLNPPSAPHVVLWPADGADLGARPPYRKDDRPGYPLVQLDDLKESEAEVVAALRRYAGPRFTAVP